MDDNTKEVLVLLITTLSTVIVAWIRMRGVRTISQQQPQSPQPPPTQAPPPSSGTPSV
jgi:hypothetical protein